jgi:hypothetical protein
MPNWESRPGLKLSTHISDSALSTTENTQNTSGLFFASNITFGILLIEDLLNMVTSLDQVLGARSSRARCDAKDSPRVDDLGEPRPETVLLLAVLLKFEVLVGIFFRVTFSLVFFVLPTTC